MSRRHKKKVRPLPETPLNESEPGAFKELFHWFRNHSLKQDIDLVKHLPFVERFAQAASRKAVGYVLSGITIMLIGVQLSLWSKTYESGVAHTLGDMIGFLIHAIGAIPFIRYAEAAFVVVFGE